LSDEEADRAADWCEVFDSGPFGTVLRDMRTKGRAVPDDEKDMDWATFKARQVHFAKGDERPTEEPPDPDRADAVRAAVDTMAWLG
jgi:hypothetical protein